jgi:dihydroneopterin aldolase
LSNSDCIQLRGLRVVCIVGVLPEERERPQPLELDIDIYADLSAAGKSDELDDTVDYGSVATTVEEICLGVKAQLLERLAELVAGRLLELDGVVAVEVTVKKIRPPVPSDLHFSAVRVTRHGQ